MSNSAEPQNGCWVGTRFYPDETSHGSADDVSEKGPDRYERLLELGIPEGATYIEAVDKLIECVDAAEARLARERGERYDEVARVEAGNMSDATKDKIWRAENAAENEQRRRAGAEREARRLQEKCQKLSAEIERLQQAFGGDRGRLRDLEKRARQAERRLVGKQKQVDQLEALLAQVMPTPLIPLPPPQTVDTVGVCAEAGPAGCSEAARLVNGKLEPQSKICPPPFPGKEPARAHWDPYDVDDTL